MSKFSFVKEVDIDRDEFFAISTNYEKFTKHFIVLFQILLLIR